MSAPDDEERPFTENRWVRIMCDYSADGVWDRRGMAGSPDELPIPAELQQRILAWQAWYEERNPFVGEEGEPEDDFDVAAFSAEGLAIAKAVKAALPDWTVIYWDEALYQRADKARFDERGVYRGDPPRTDYEYEISLPESPPVP